MISDEAVEAAARAVRNSMLAHDYTASESNFRTDIRTALEAAAPLLVDPIETGREAALAQWHERWRILREFLTDAVMPVADHYLRFMDRLEQDIPVGTAPDPRNLLSHAIAEVGRIIESLPPHERKGRVHDLLAEQTEAFHRDFLIGVFVWAHETRMMLLNRVTIQLEPERAERLLELLELLTPERAGSYPASNDAQALREDLRLMMERR